MSQSIMIHLHIQGTKADEVMKVSFTVLKISPLSLMGKIREMKGNPTKLHTTKMLRITGAVYTMCMCESIVGNLKKVVIMYQKNDKGIRNRI